MTPRKTAGGPKANGALLEAALAAAATNQEHRAEEPSNPSDNGHVAGPDIRPAEPELEPEHEPVAEAAPAPDDRPAAAGGLAVVEGLALVDWLFPAESPWPMDAYWLGDPDRPAAAPPPPAPAPQGPPVGGPGAPAPSEAMTLTETPHSGHVLPGVRPPALPGPPGFTRRDLRSRRSARRHAERVGIAVVAGFVAFNAGALVGRPVLLGNRPDIRASIDSNSTVSRSAGTVDGRGRPAAGEAAASGSEPGRSTGADGVPAAPAPPRLTIPALRFDAPLGDLAHPGVQAGAWGPLSLAWSVIGWRGAGLANLGAGDEIRLDAVTYRVVGAEIVPAGDASKLTTPARGAQLLLFTGAGESRLLVYAAAV